MSPAILAAYLAYFAAATLSPLQRRWIALKREPEGLGQIDFAFRVSIVVAMFSLMIPMFVPLELHGSYAKLAILACITGVTGAGYAIASFTAQRYVEAGVTALIGNISAPVTIILATIFLGESLDLPQIIGAGLLIVGVVIVSKKHYAKRFSFDGPFMLMLFGSLCMGIALTSERALQIQTGLSAATILSWWSQAACLGAAALVAGRKSSYTPRDVAITGILRASVGVSWVTVLFLVANLSIVASITTFKVITIFAISALLLGEHDDMHRKVVGSIIATAGLLLMR